MYTYKDKMNIIASFNAKHKTCYQYDLKTDTVVEEFNRKSFPPIPFYHVLPPSVIFAFLKVVQIDVR